jgi:hypothetical protein
MVRALDCGSRGPPFEAGWRYHHNILTLLRKFLNQTTSEPPLAVFRFHLGSKICERGAVGAAKLSQPVEKPQGPRWLHEIKLDGFRMAARLGQIPSVPDIGLDAPIRARAERRPNRGRRFESRRSFLILVDPGTYRQPSCSDLVRGPSRIICRRNKSEPSLVSWKATWEIEIAGSGRKPIAVRNSERVRRYPDFLAGERL